MTRALAAALILTALPAAPAGAADTPRAAVILYYKSSARGDLAGMKRAATGPLRRGLDKKTPRQLWVETTIALAFSRVGETTVTGDRAVVEAHFKRHVLSEKSFPAILAMLLARQKDPAKKKKLARIMMALKPLVVRRLSRIRCLLVRIDGRWLLEKTAPARQVRPKE
jgi:hypothetical protein